MISSNYQDEYLFLLSKAYQGWQFYQLQIDDCDNKIEEVLKELISELPQPKPSLSSPSRHHPPDIANLHEMMVQLTCGRDATVLPGISDTTMLKLTAALGLDLSRWPTEKHFTSWLGLSPRKYQSGKTNKKKRNKVNTKAGQIFKDSAMSIANSKYLALRGFYNRIKSKHGAKSANKATARKLAVLYYRFFTKGLQYVEMGLDEYEQNYKEIMRKNLAKKARSLGYELVTI